ncbi:peptide-methionine (S)-S-oxide reductase MsrA [Sphingobacterium sp. SRCM116780]|uniref:peptide-methionine (S)-S-oxide reductase MsrA n=1 Tax=Sphingobacterium sp. SRCM116780 TaxID=2907623 RepID=UPI001F454408|nr:peptide-methionine (S)-S-oxide reductase MsrA [Sphingobacterium sp. SRCM116780]UIR55402.1 peptide-methionine (S)-S-oxide reductase MsrA [Sphingobacterium sp. SRCM116780]
MTFSLWASCQSKITKKATDSFAHLPESQQGKLDTATFAGGCFWCVEAQFKTLDGVKKVISGYTGGEVKNPTYSQVSTGATGHAEAINVLYDPKKITFDKLLEAFFIAHDPTQLNRQGNDVGTQYRSAIFIHDKQQLDKVKYYLKKMEEEKLYDRPIVTEINAFKVFYPAEDYHQNYYANNKNESYCQYVIKPKLEKFKHIFTSTTKD